MEPTRAMIAYGRLLKLQQEHLHDEDSQHDESSRDSIPETHGVPLKGEWAACASDSVKSSSKGTAESNAPLYVPIVMPKHTDGSRESTDTAPEKSSWTAARLVQTCMRTSMRQVNIQVRQRRLSERPYA